MHQLGRFASTYRMLENTIADLLALIHQASTKKKLTKRIDYMCNLKRKWHIIFKIDINLHTLCTVHNEIRFLYSGGHR